jgi:DNA-binding FadR family transcriptional regulator
MVEARPVPARQSLTAKVVEVLRREIESGARAPGDKLPTEPLLTKQFGVSRTVIREAIAGLRADGLVESRHGVGVFVLDRPSALGARRPSPFVASKISDVIEELELRAAVEIEAAGLAAQRASPAQEAEIDASYQHFTALVQRGASTTEADFAFHMAIAHATNNTRFADFLAHLGRRTIPREKLLGVLGEAVALPNRDAKLDAEHREVAEAIARRDPEAARASMRAHLIGSLERYRGLARSAIIAGSPTGD